MTVGSAALELDRAVVRAEALSKVYGEGDTLVVALDTQRQRVDDHAS